MYKIKVLDHPCVIPEQKELGLYHFQEQSYKKIQTNVCDGFGNKKMPDPNFQISLQTCRIYEE